VWQLSLCSHWGDVQWLFLKGTRKGQPSDLATGLGKEFGSETASVNGITLHYVRGGKGPVVTLIHGFPQDWFEYRQRRFNP
jgi:hypothetical protein